jgi:hypothetical protein
MSEYACQRCGFKSNFKHVLVNHLQRKKPCDPFYIDIPCMTLLQQYKARAKSVKRPQLYQTTSNDNIFHLIDEIKHLKEKVAILEGTTNSQTINNNTINTVINNNLNLSLNPFQNERLDHISPHDLQSFALDAKEGLVNLIRKIYFCNDMPENKNVRFKSAKQKLLETYDADDWVEHNAHWVLDKMINKGYTILSKHMLENINMASSTSDEIDRYNFMTIILNEMKGPYTQKYYNVRREIFIIIKNESGKGEFIRLAPNDELEPETDSEEHCV